MTLTGHRTAVADLRRKADLLATPAAPSIDKFGALLTGFLDRTAPR